MVKLLKIILIKLKSERKKMSRIFKKIKSRNFARVEETKEFKKKQKIEKEKTANENQENFNNFILELLENSKNDSNLISIKKDGLAPFFKELTFEKNKIHILRGNNGQGKSTLLKNIINATSFNVLNDLHGRLIYGSNNGTIGYFLNNNFESNIYKWFDKDNFLYNQFNNELSNVKNNITLYSDFTIDFYKNQAQTIFDTIEETYGNYSNGERKIKAINNIFHFIKSIEKLKLKDIKTNNKIELIIGMDEPESGLSVEIQEEFYKKIKFHFNKLKKNNVNITFFIVSHSFIWKNEKDISIHNVRELKLNKETSKKEYSKIFV